jgi:hypothetical protein
MEPYKASAHCAEDVYLLSRFLELSDLAEEDADGDCLKLLLRVLRFLHLCDYSMEDICSILAHASVYFRDVFKLCGDQMGSSEVGNVLATLIFIAHCYVQDETCPLHMWHKHLFRKYCALNTLNAAVMRLLEIRRHVLRLDPETLDRVFSSLLQAADRRLFVVNRKDVDHEVPRQPPPPPAPPTAQVFGLSREGSVPSVGQAVLV